MNKTSTIITAFLIFLCPIFTKAQMIQKGTTLVGGNLLFASVSQSNGSYPRSSSSIFILGANVMPLVTSHIAFGGTFNFVSSGNTSNLSIGPSLRAYLNNKGTVLPFIGGNFLFATQSNTSNSYTVGAGASFFLSPQVALDMGASYGNTVSTSSVSSSSDLNVFSFSMGLQIFLQKKNK